MITICLTYFKSLTLANFAAALHSVRTQDLTYVKEVVIIDNDTEDSAHELRTIADALAFPVSVHIFSYKHGDPTQTHAWSTNTALAKVVTPWVFFTRADYILDPSLLARAAAVVHQHEFEGLAAWRGFVTSNGCHLGIDVAECEALRWRERGPAAVLSGTVFDYTSIDSGVWLGRRGDFWAVNGLDGRLTAWGHAQTDFQHRLFLTGVEFARIPEVLFWHPAHGGEKDINLAHQQLRDCGFDIKDLWKRYEGVSPY